MIRKKSIDGKSLGVGAGTGYRLDELPNNIRAVREAKGISNTELAAACGVTRGTVNKWETTNPPKDPDTCRRVATAHATPIDDVFPGGLPSARTRKLPKGFAHSGDLFRNELRARIKAEDHDAPNNLRLIRGLRDLTLEELAERANSTVTTIHHLEVGKIQLSETWLHRLADALDCDPNDLPLKLTPRCSQK